MSVYHARTFILRAVSDKDFRARLYKAAGPEELRSILEQEEMVFSQAEFIEAHSQFLVQAPSEEAADEWREFFYWWHAMTQP